MKISSLFTLILIISGIFFMFGLMINESNNDYEANIAENLTTGYDYVSEANETISPLVEKLELMADTETGWFTKIALGLSAVPYAIVILPQVAFKGLETGSAITTGILVFLAVPGYIVLLVLIYFIVVMIFKLLEFFNRTPNV